MQGMSSMSNVGKMIRIVVFCTLSLGYKRELLVDAKENGLLIQMGNWFQHKESWGSHLLLICSCHKRY